LKSTIKFFVAQRLNVEGFGFGFGYVGRLPEPRRFIACDRLSCEKVGRGRWFGFGRLVGRGRGRWKRSAARQN